MARGRSTKNIGGSGPVGCQERTLSLVRDGCDARRIRRHPFPEGVDRCHRGVPIYWEAIFEDWVEVVSTVFMGGEKECPGFGFQVPSFGCRVWGVGCRVQGVECWVSGVGCRVSGVGCRV
jgi:hypothetical protein